MNFAGVLVSRIEDRKEIDMVRSIINRGNNQNTTNTNTLSNRGMPTPLMPLSRVIDQFFEDPFFALAPVALSREQSSGLALDLSEDDQDFIVRASLPGFAENEITAEVNEGVLTIRAEKNEEQQENNERWFKRERRWGSVERQVVLPVPVRDEQAHAELINGVLTLRLPKVQKAPAKKITIGSGQKSQNQVAQGTGQSGQNSAQTNTTGNRREERQMAGAGR